MVGIGPHQVDRSHVPPRTPMELVTRLGPWVHVLRTIGKMLTRFHSLLKVTHPPRDVVPGCHQFDGGSTCFGDMNKFQFVFLFLLLLLLLLLFLNLCMCCCIIINIGGSHNNNTRFIFFVAAIMIDSFSFSFNDNDCFMLYKKESCITKNTTYENKPHYYWECNRHIISLFTKSFLCIPLWHSSLFTKSFLCIPLCHCLLISADEGHLLKALLFEYSRDITNLLC